MLISDAKTQVSREEAIWVRDSSSKNFDDDDEDKNKKSTLLLPVRRYYKGKVGIFLKG